MNGLLAQRLVRTLCADCRESAAAPPDLIRRFGLDTLTDARPIVLSRPVGCERCGGSGYRGRTMILELLVVDDAIRRLVLRHAEARSLEAQAVEDGMEPMFRHGLRKALAGVTTIDEVLRVIRDP